MNSAAVSARVLWVVVDSLGTDQVRPELMPWSCHLAQQGGSASRGTPAVLPALTYPNHATLVTGVEPAVHGLGSNRVFRDGTWRGAETCGPAVPTVFDKCADAGISTVAVFGDQNLVGVCGARSATTHWPPGGVHDPATELAVTGYARDTEVVAAACSLGLAAHQLAIVQLDEMDATRHTCGPDSAESETMAREVDAALEELASLYSEVWNDTVMVVVSDHDQETVTPGAAVPFDEVVAEALGVEAPENPWDGDHSGRWRTGGTCAWLAPGTVATLGGTAGILELQGVEGARLSSDGSCVAWGAPGAVFGLDWGQLGDHGSGRTAKQVALVGGGHRCVAALGARLAAGELRATDWARIVFDLSRAGRS